MNEIVRSLILGVVQGLTEFLPVSSSGHLEIINFLFGPNQNLDSDFTLVLLAHLGTAFSIVFVFRKDIYEITNEVLRLNKSPQTQLFIEIVVSMIPALIVGLLFEDEIEQLFQGGIWMVGLALIFTAIILWLTPLGIKSEKSVGLNRALLIGLAQAVAIMPGISRSGMTIAASLLLGVGRGRAAKFSFLMVLPIIFGKAILDIMTGDLMLQPTSTMSYLLTVISSFVVGVIACKWMIKLVESVGLKNFGLYCFVVGLFAVTMHFYG